MENRSILLKCFNELVSLPSEHRLRGEPEKVQFVVAVYKKSETHGSTSRNNPRARRESERQTRLENGEIVRCLGISNACCCIERQGPIGEREHLLSAAV